MLQVGIVPVDLERSIAFYRDVIGLTYTGAVPVIEGRSLHLFAVGDAVFKLLELPAGSPTPEVPSPPGPFHAATGIRWVTFDVDPATGGIDAVVERIGPGVVWQLPVTELRPGLRVCIVEDPDGNAVELVERV